MKSIIIKEKLLRLLTVTSILVVVGCQFLIGSTTALAENMSFAVTPEIPQNQKDRSKTYFDLEMKADQSQTIDVTLKNNTDKELTVEVNANTAFTNDNGVADYSQSDRTDFDSTLKTPFSTIVKPQEDEIKLPANGQAVAKIDIKMPKEEYDGLILGGLHFSEKQEETEDTSEGGVQIKNKFAYVVGVSLRETTNEVKTHLELNDVVPTQVNYRNFVQANLQNTEAEIVKDLSVDARVYTEKGTEVLHETKKEDMRMVPNSNFNFPISWDNKEFKAGTYRLEMDAVGDGEDYHWTKYFTISNKEAKKLNDAAVELDKDSKLWLYILIAAVCIIILLLILIIFVLRKKKKDENEKTENTPKTKNKKKAPKKKVKSKKGSGDKKRGNK
ncbi:DUF916 and DUF3324 domain-containing protein [Enterococcus termitis]|uniref:Uncharacterized protein n=1 Tax=Enterococcus termitis TaxID=332950 RepID=A0A1E5GAP7_9ENTE|nr:DUF916 and DUF3324 domain-containing protein [Enterococcus termitis]OEG09786.1 hypothetical protein BCR25_09770 [Enterococcus termitis]